MKWCAIIILILIGTVKSRNVLEKRAVSRRSVRQTLSSITPTPLYSLRDSIIKNCVNNGISANDLRDMKASFDRMARFMSNVNIYTTPKEEYINNITEYTNDTNSKISRCLKDSQKYFSNLDLEIITSLINFVYDNKDILISTDWESCVQKLRSNDQILVSYLTCLRDRGRELDDGPSIPNSKTEFCKKFIPRNRCLPDTVDEYCKNSTIVSKFTKNYKKALQLPCKLNESEAE
ncbi:uncharacterized protein LOC130895402 [Diorhabda carinulata]|uniref:uncharacterized protein LOC130895402 n=1 Tax=Diorhabda carinulata TaxID=1163345 RepID=UPI0025A2996E|nr:uncharacterized protein LOC130895402 [Diorhabda carinulata]